MGQGHGHGHGKGRRFGNPEELAGYVARLTGPERDAWQKPDEVLAALGLSPCDVVAEVGAGPGYFSLRLAARVQHVFAVEVEPRLLALLLERLRGDGTANVTPILALPDDPLLPAGSCDAALVVDTAHHFPDRVEYLRRLARALRPGGRLAVIDFHDRETPVGPALDQRLGREELLRAASAAGLRLAAEHAFLPHQYFLILQRAEDAAPGEHRT